MKVLAFGEVLWDIIENKAHIGGAPFNLAAHLSKLGAESYIVSAVGNDKLGKEVFHKTSELSINNEFIELKDEYPTGTVDVILSDSGSPTYTINEGVAWDNINLSDSNEIKILNTEWDLVCFGSLAQRSASNKAFLEKLLKSVNAKNIFCDINLRQEYYDKTLIEDSFKSSNIVKLNDEEVEVISKTLFNKDLSIEAFAEKVIALYNIEVLCITKGGDGAAAFTNTSSYSVSGENIKVADTIGAGDSFSAGFLASHLNNNSISSSLELANKIGGFVASSVGAIPEYSDDLSREIKNYIKY